MQTRCLLIAALLVSAACAHTSRSTSPEPASDYDGFDSDPQPLGTYSFMVPINDDWDTDWPDSAPAARSDSWNDTSTPAGTRPTPAPAKRRQSSPSTDAEFSDIPTGMVVVYDDSLSGDGWMDSGAGRQPSPATRSGTSPDHPPSVPADLPSDLAPDSSTGGRGSEYVVQRRERQRETPTPSLASTRQRAPSPARVAPDADTDGDDPFARLQRDLREAGVEETLPTRSQPAEPPPESLWTRSQESALPQRPGDDQRMAPGREAGVIGVHAVAGAGVLVARDPQGGHGAHFAYGVNVGWNPEFARDVVFDVGFWRAATRDGTDFASVATSYHHFSLRALWQPPLPNNVFLGAGGGVVLTQSLVGYSVGGAEADTVRSMAHRPGLEATLAAGTRFKPLEVRVEMRTLLRGGMRLDFLPTMSVGATF